VRRLERGVQDRFENEGLAFQEKVRSGFLLLAKQEPQRIKLVNALQEIVARWSGKDCGCGAAQVIWSN
jgi:dTMP kinase